MAAKNHEMKKSTLKIGFSDLLPGRRYATPSYDISFLYLFKECVLLDLSMASQWF